MVLQQRLMWSLILEKIHKTMNYKLLDSSLTPQLTIHLTMGITKHTQLLAIQRQILVH